MYSIPPFCLICLCSARNSKVLPYYYDGSHQKEVKVDDNASRLQIRIGRETSYTGRYINVRSVTSKKVAYALSGEFR